MDAPKRTNLRPCAKHTCGEPAAYAYTFDYDAMVVWLDNLGAVLDSQPSSALCSRHAERFSVPRGWQLVDRRSNMPPLFVSATSERRRDTDHPSVRARSLSGIEIRPARRQPEVPAEEHPSGPLEIDNRREHPDVTRALEQIAADLARIPIEAGAVLPPEPMAAVGIAEIDVTDAALAYDEEATFGDEIDDESDALFMAALAEAASAYVDDDSTQTGHRR